MKILSLLIFITSFSFILPQDENDINYLSKVYSDLEYDSEVLNSFKKVWILNDKFIVMQIYNMLEKKNAIRKNRLPLTNAQRDTVYSLIEKGNILIEFRKRFYDEEIEQMRFFFPSTGSISGESDIIDPIVDWVQISKLLGKDKYNEMKLKDYQVIEGTKDYYESGIGFQFDVYLNLTKPHLMFWSSTTDSSNKYLVYLFGKWGNNYINLPGWFYHDYIVGLKLRYMDDLIKNPTKENYEIEAGTGIYARQPTDDRLGGGYRKLFSGGNNLYLKVGGYPLSFLGYGDIKLELETMINLNNKSVSDYGGRVKKKFYTIKNYVTFAGTFQNLANLGDFGILDCKGGVAVHDVENLLVDPSQVDFVKLGESSFNTLVFAEGILSRNADFLQHRISAYLNYNISGNYMFFGLTTHFTISNTLGLDFLYSIPAFGQENIPFWQNQDYFVVFSPVLRINY